MHKSSKTRHENQTTKAYEDVGLAAPVPFSYVDLDKFPHHPWVRPSDFLRVFVQQNKLGLLTGGSSFDILAEFWQRYYYVQPSHAVYKLLDTEQRRFTIPCMLYADEGQTLKKQSLMVVSIQPAIGAGIHAAEGCASSGSMGNNFIGSCYKTRFLLSVLAKRAYKTNGEVLDVLMEQIVRDCNDCLESGVSVCLEGKPIKLRLAIVQVKGDWPILTRLGHLTRSFHRLTKGGLVTTTGKEKVPKGICHLCRAGCPGVPIQEYTEQAKWCETYLKDPPFDPNDPSPLWELHQADSKEVLYHYDLFHTCHKGIFAELAGSAIVSWQGWEFQFLSQGRLVF